MVVLIYKLVNLPRESIRSIKNIHINKQIMGSANLRRYNRMSRWKNNIKTSTKITNNIDR